MFWECGFWNNNNLSIMALQWRNFLIEWVSKSYKMNKFEFVKNCWESVKVVLLHWRIFSWDSYGWWWWWWWDGTINSLEKLLCLRKSFQNYHLVLNYTMNQVDFTFGWKHFFMALDFKVIEISDGFNHLNSWSCRTILNYNISDIVLILINSYKLKPKLLQTTNSSSGLVEIRIN